MEPKRGATWQILVPHRSRTDLLIDVAEACRALPGDDARVMRRILLDELVNDTATSAGELLDKIERASPAERRAMLDTARVKAGLPSTADIEFEERHAQAQRDPHARAFNAPPPRYGLSDVGSVVDFAEQELERQRAAVREDTLQRLHDEREAIHAAAAAEAREHERAVAEAWRSSAAPVSA